jgi:L-seryl-tRNA(Ser) seleniumtransferase
MSSLRSLPSVDGLLQLPPVQGWITQYGRPLTLEGLRMALSEARDGFPETGSVPDEDGLLQRVQELLYGWTSSSLVPVINASGVILHTNLGRAPLSQAALQAVREVALGYSNLEYDLQKGQRGSRLVHAEALLKRLTGAEAALVVNNNAAAVLLVLAALARRKGVVIARSQLVEIGGGFRVPEVMKQSGARLVEVGTTNRVYLEDYQQAVDEQPVALVMRAHQSNFRLVGFTSEPTLKELAGWSQRVGLPLVDDLGSGSLLDTTCYGLAHEPMVQESLEAGVDLVCFSGDKLLGGPQAGLVLGRADLVARLRKHPLARAVRADKLCLAALTATLLHYVKDEAERQIPVWQMISARPEEIERRARSWVEVLGIGNLCPGQSTVGGGSLPEETLPTCLLTLEVTSPNRFLGRLRQASPPVIARLEQDRVVFDPRTVLPEQGNALLAAIRGALESHR